MSPPAVEEVTYIVQFELRASDPRFQALIGRLKGPEPLQALIMSSRERASLAIRPLKAVEAGWAREYRHAAHWPVVTVGA